MRVLWVGTKPPWPPVDGGRLVAALTLQALARAAEVTVAAPAISPVAPASAQPANLAGIHLVPAALAPAPFAALAALARNRAYSVVRHAHAPVAAVVRRLLESRRFDVVHAEQLQALAMCDAARSLKVPLVLRAQNVESDLWSDAAAGAWLLGPWMRGQQRLLAEAEAAAVRGVTAVVALTREDRDRLAALGTGVARLHHVPAPFPALLPPGPHSLVGEPAVVLFGSRGWRPNADAELAFVRELWPSIRSAVPGAVLHLFGNRRSDAARGIAGHAAPADGSEPFAPGSVLALPLPFASGVRMRLLEAWSRGVPVVASAAAARGSGARDDEHVLIADTAADWAAAMARVATEPDLAARLTRNGRALLTREHDPDDVAARLLGVYADAAA